MKDNIASRDKRVIGGIIDIVIIALITEAFSFICKATGLYSEAENNMSYVGGWPFFVSFLLILLLNTYLEFKIGKTPGKYVAKTRVVSESGEQPTLPQVAIRNLLRIIDGFFFYSVGLIIMHFSEKNQRLGDMLGKTIVVNNKAISVRTLDHPKDLGLGDIVKFGFLPQEDLSNKRLEVIEVNTYDFRGETSTSFTLKSETGAVVWLTVTNEDGEEYLSISKKVNRAEVTQTFLDEDFGQVFNEGVGLKLARQEETRDLTNWTADTYIKTEDCSKGYFHKGDYRERTLPKYEDESESFDFYLLENTTEEFFIEIEIYEGGDTEVYMGVYLDLSSIDELWPKS